MSAQRREPSGRPRSGRCRTEYIRVPADRDLARVILGAVMSQRSSRGWRLIGARRERGGDIAVLEWETSESWTAQVQRAMRGVCTDPEHAPPLI